MTLQSGELIQNRYRIMHQLGDSAYRALDMSLRQPCVIKEFSGTTSERVTQLAHVQHPNLPRVIDLVRQGEQSLLVMDFISGTSLSEHLFQAENGVPADSAQTWLEQLVDTLAYLHQHEPAITHGDVSVDHIVLRPDGSVALTNFSSYSRKPTDDLVNLGHVLGHLATGALPPASKAHMIGLLDGRSDPLAQRALAMLNGTITQIQDALAPLTPRLPDKSEAATMGLETYATADDNVSTVPLENRVQRQTDTNTDSPPIMPWDKPNQDNGAQTEVWGARPDSAEPKVKTAPPESALKDIQKTELLPSQTVPLGTAGTPSPPSTAHNKQKDEDGSGFNWLWIVVGIMAGVIILSITCIGLMVWFWDDLVEPPPSSSFYDQDEFAPAQVVYADMFAENGLGQSHKVL